MLLFGRELFQLLFEFEFVGFTKIGRELELFGLLLLLLIIITFEFVGFTGLFGLFGLLLISLAILLLLFIGKYVRPTDVLPSKFINLLELE